MERSLRTPKVLLVALLAVVALGVASTWPAQGLAALRAAGLPQQHGPLACASACTVHTPEVVSVSGNVANCGKSAKRKICE